MGKFYWKPEHRHAMNRTDWLIGITYLVTLVAGYVYFGAIAFWVYVILELRDWMDRRDMDEKYMSRRGGGS